MSEKCVIGEYCKKHGFIHGGEAEELRSHLEQVIHNNEVLGARSVQIKFLRQMLESIDARDSVAFLEVTDGRQPVRGLSVAKKESDEGSDQGQPG